jgi:hypothetical protein
MKYGLKSFLLPMLVGIPIIILMVVQIVRESLSKAAVASGPDKRTSRGSGLIAALFLLLFILFIYLAGFLVVIPVGVLAYVKFSGEKWYLAISLGLVMFFVVFILSHVLGLYLYEGILFL